MRRTNDTDIQTASHNENMAADVGEVKVMRFGHKSFHWEDYLGKYHINFICHKGVAHFSSADVFYQVEPFDYVAWTIDTEVSEVWFSHDFEGEILLTSRNFLLENNPESLWATKGYLLIKSSPVIHLLKADFEQLKIDFEAIRERQKDSSNLFRMEILGRYLQIYLLDLWNICKLEISRNERINSNSASLFNRFLGLVQQHALKQREASYYADLLCVTAKYLSEISRKSSGKSALYWINGYAVQEILSLMKRSDLTIAEISEMAEFYNPSHFSRYFKKLLGVTPTEYRLNLQKRNRKS